MAQSQAGCTLCADASPPIGNNSFGGGTDCSLIDASIGMTPAGDKYCTLLQVQGYSFCGCPTFPDTFCNMCDYNTTGYVALPKNRQSRVISGTNLTCAAAEFLPVSDGECGAAQAAASYCGCPNAPARSSNCSLCENASTTVVVNNRRLPPLFDTTCAELDDSIGQSAPPCRTSNATANVPLLLQGYCGCPPTADAPSSQCSFCGGNNTVVNPKAIVDPSSGVTCRDVETMAMFVNSAEYCTTLQTDYNVTCCLPTPAPVAAPVAAAPVAAPSADGSGGSIAGDNSTTTTPAAGPAPTGVGASVTSAAPPRCRWTAAVVWGSLILLLAV